MSQEIFVVVEQDQYGYKVLLSYRHKFDEAKDLAAEYKRNGKESNTYYVECVPYSGK